MEVPGHTEGSIVLIDAENKLLFAGDNDNSTVWLFLKECLPLEIYLQTLQNLNARNDEFDIILPGHGDPMDKTFIEEQIVCAQNIISGECVGEKNETSAGPSLLCTFKRAGIAYDPAKITIKQ
jgi:glyoxylase-like metal-dependent hydrolase (beta-lactamase superfamily II)